MTKKPLFATAFAICAITLAEAQVTITSIEQLTVGNEHAWSAPRFSPDGKSIFFTTAENNGIWEYSLASHRVQMLTSDPGSGYGFAISLDGGRIAYRRTSIDAATHERRQEIVDLTLADGTARTVASGRDLSVPTFFSSDLVFSDGTKTLNLGATLQAAGISVLGIENTKIAIALGGTKKLLDPFGNGHYVWPTLSPDQSRLAAYELGHGAFVCDLQGNVTASLGRHDAPSWTRDGRWIVFMDDRDNGEEIISSDLVAVSPDGRAIVPLTSSTDIREMYPQCSPTDNLIVCSTLEGGLLLLRYEEALR